MKKLSILLVSAIALVFSTQTASAQSATIYEMNTTYDIEVDGQFGIIIDVVFDVAGMNGRTGICAAYFYFSNGQKLMDNNGVYKAQDGQVAAFEYYTPEYNEASYSQFQFFIPYDEFHLQDGSHDMYYTITVFDSNNNALATSSPVEFSLSNN